MFGFGIQKLLVLALLIGAVWYGFKFFGRLDESRRRVERVAKAAAAKAAAGVSEAAAGASKAAAGASKEASEPAAQDMERCETCGDFVAAAEAGSCGREGCPFPG